MASEAEQAWLEHFTKTGDDLAALELYFPDVGKNAKDPAEAKRVRCSQLKSRLVPDFLERVNRRLAYSSMDMLNIIEELAKDSGQDNIKLSAARDWLDRASIGADKAQQGSSIQIVLNADTVQSVEVSTD